MHERETVGFCITGRNPGIKQKQNNNHKLAHLKNAVRQTQNCYTRIIGSVQVDSKLTNEKLLSVESIRMSTGEVWLATHTPFFLGLYSLLCILITPLRERAIIRNAIIYVLRTIHLFNGPSDKSPTKQVVSNNHVICQIYCIEIYLDFQQKYHYYVLLHLVFNLNNRVYWVIFRN